MTFMKSIFVIITLSIVSLKSFAQQSCQLELAAMRSLEAETPNLEFVLKAANQRMQTYRNNYHILNCGEIFRFRTDQRNPIAECAAKTVSAEIQNEWISGFREDVRNSFEASLGVENYRRLFLNQDENVVYSRLHQLLGEGTAYDNRLNLLHEAQQYLSQNCTSFSRAAIFDFFERNESIKVCISSIKGIEFMQQQIDEISPVRHRANLDRARESYFSCVQGFVNQGSQSSTTSVEP